MSAHKGEVQVPHLHRSTTHPQYVFVRVPLHKQFCTFCAFEKTTPESGLCISHRCTGGLWIPEAEAAIIALEGETHG